MDDSKKKWPQNSVRCQISRITATLIFPLIFPDFEWHDQRKRVLTFLKITANSLPWKNGFRFRPIFLLGFILYRELALYFNHSKHNLVTYAFWPHTYHSLFHHTLGQIYDTLFRKSYFFDWLFGPILGKNR